LCSLFWIVVAHLSSCIAEKIRLKTSLRFNAMMPEKHGLFRTLIAKWAQLVLRTIGNAAIRMPRRLWSVRCVNVGLILLLVLLILGCGQSENGRVSGKVRYNDTALPSGTVTFYGHDNLSDQAFIDPDGSYIATKVPLGPVKITVSTPQPVSDKSKKAFEKIRKGATTSLGGETIAIPSRYSKPEQSGLELTVTKGTQIYNIDLK
jgi:hypothetical protein